MTNRDATLAMDAARVRLNYLRGYLRAVLWTMRMVPTGEVPSMAMSKDAVIYYNPEEVAKWPLEACVTVLYHEVCHWMRRHYERMADFPDERCALVAAELELQGDLEDEINGDSNLDWPPQGYIAPGKPPFESLPKGLLAEEYYRLLEQQQQQSGGAGGQQQGKGRQQGHGQGQGKGQQQGQGQGQQQGQGQSQQGQDQQPGQGQGSVSDGHWKDWEQQDHPEGITEAQGRLIARKLAQDIQEAAERDKSQRGIGSVPGWMRRWAEMQLYSKVPWHKVLDRWIRQSIGHVLGFSDYSFRTPNRRAALSGLILPGLVKPVPRIAVVLDTSGSMSGHQVGLALTEIGGVLRAMGMLEGVWVLATDAEAHTCQRVFNPRQVDVVGGGGTILESGIARAMKLRPRPEIVVVISDCLNYWDEVKPARVSIVIVRVGTGKPPTWADKVIDVEDVVEDWTVWTR